MHETTHYWCLMTSDSILVWLPIKIEITTGDEPLFSATLKL